MKIRTFAADNYKSIYKVEPFALTNGFNIVIGQNTAGKTALLEILSLQFQQNHIAVKRPLPIEVTLLKAIQWLMSSWNWLIRK